MVMTSYFKDYLALVFWNDIEIGFSKILIPNIAFFTSILGSWVHMISDQELSWSFSILELLSEPVELVLSFIGLVSRVILCVEVYCVQTENWYVTVDINSVISSVHESFFDFIQVRKLRVGVLLIEPQIVHIWVVLLLVAFVWSLVVVLQVIVTECWDHRSVREFLVEGGRHSVQDLFQ